MNNLAKTPGSIKTHDFVKLNYLIGFYLFSVMSICLTFLTIYSITPTLPGKNIALTALFASNAVFLAFVSIYVLSMYVIKAIKEK